MAETLTLSTVSQANPTSHLLGHWLRSLVTTRMNPYLPMPECTCCIRPDRTHPHPRVQTPAPLHAAGHPREPASSLIPCQQRRIQSAVMHSVARRQDKAQSKCLAVLRGLLEARHGTTTPPSILLPSYMTESALLYCQKGWNSATRAHSSLITTQCHSPSQPMRAPECPRTQYGILRASSSSLNHEGASSSSLEASESGRRAGTRTRRSCCTGSARPRRLLLFQVKLGPLEQ